MYRECHISKCSMMVRLSVGRAIQNALLLMLLLRLLLTSRVTSRATTAAAPFRVWQGRKYVFFPAIHQRPTGIVVPSRRRICCVAVAG